MTTVTSNQFKSTTIYGTFSNVDSTNGAILADAKFKRNVTIEGNLIAGNVLIKNYGNSNTNFSTGNTDILGNNNTRFGYFTGLLSGYSNAVFGDQSLQNCTGHSNTAIGHNSQNGNTSYNWNTSVGSNSNITGGSSNIAIGHVAQCSNCTNSIVIGNSITCTTNNQILLGSSVHTVSIPGSLSANIINTSGDLSCGGLLSANVLNTSGNLTCYGLLSANVLNTSGDLTCNGLITGNRLSTSIITFSESLNNISTTVFGYLSGLSSNIQQQINNCNSNISTLQTKTTDIIWTPGQINKTTISNQCETQTLSFSNTLNNISTTTFSYLSGLTSNIQQQLNAISNTNPVGMIITYAGTSTSLTGYLLCDGTFYNSSQYTNLFNAIGYTYGDGGNGNFRVPNYLGVFLRSRGSQDVQLNVIAGGGAAIFKNFQAPELGKAVPDQSAYFSTGNYVDQISTQTRTVVTGSPILLNNYSTANVISSLSYTTTNNSYNFGNSDVHPAHASVQYFIKY
jgi:microcystin-dependent protein